MHRSRFPFTTSLAAIVVLGACSGGDDETCGPGDAPAAGITAEVEAGSSVVYGDFVAGPNNDCPDPSDPSAPTSLTIVGTQTGQAFPLTLCVRRPDRFGATPAALGTDIVIEDVGAVVGDCQIRLDRQGAAPSGTATATGLCDRGTNAAGFALELSGAVSVIRTCGTVSTPLRLTLSGRTAVAAQR